MPEGKQQTGETGKNTSEQRGWEQEPMLILLRDNWAYTTGDVLEHWLADPDLSREEKDAILDKRTTIQSYLSRYMQIRENRVRKTINDNAILEEDLDRIFSPVDTQPYLRTNSHQKLFLGAQFKWVAGRYLGLAGTPSTEDTLALLRASEEGYQRFDVKKLSEPAPAVAAEEIQTPAVLADEVVQHPGESVGDAAANQNSRFFSGFNLNVMTRWLVFNGLSAKMTAVVFLTFCVGLSFGALLWDQTTGKRLENFEKKWNTEGPRVVDGVSDVTAGKVLPPEQLYLALWKRAYNPELDIDEIRPLFEALSDKTEYKWKAMASYSMGDAYINRGRVNEALKHYQDAEGFLTGTELSSDLRKIHLAKARCFFHLQDAEALLEETDKARNIPVASSYSRIQYFDALYWFLKGDLPTAISHAKESLHISLSEGAKGQSGYYYASLGLFYTADGRLDDAYRHLRLAQEIAAQTNDKSLTFQLQGYEMLWAEYMNLPTVAPEGTLSRDLFEESLILRRSFIELARAQSSQEE
ncbi:hypothetical protein [Acanthopleuribacter pedis]|uniref:Tetratricopeptide repeat protein n=1 Tax=Acanthopleuribacter pedis TaxID=442870 RepID=A0A8J7U5E3_9BACT|nr:hypothetical protein [Acanthopleuribacter pedis]MBO1320353.1 hypothetical protein [Acanthopleuribacter pedis]